MLSSYLMRREEYVDHLVVPGLVARVRVQRVNLFEMLPKTLDKSKTKNKILTFINFQLC